MTFTKEQLLNQATKNIAVLRGAVERIPGASDAAVIHLKLAEITLSALAGMETGNMVLYRERNPYNGMTTGWQELTEQEYEFVKDNAGDNAEFRTVYTAPQPLTTSERAELENYRNAQQVGGPCGVRAKFNDGHHVGAGDGSYGRAGDDLKSRGMGGSGCDNTAPQQESE